MSCFQSDRQHMQYRWNASYVTFSHVQLGPQENSEAFECKPNVASTASGPNQSYPIAAFQAIYLLSSSDLQKLAHICMHMHTCYQADIRMYLPVSSVYT